MVKLESKIKGALYGFAIGDAMGATTEFMNEEQIKKKYGRVSDIIGGGWLSIHPGNVTDDTELMLCVCEAIAHTNNSVFDEDNFFIKQEVFLERCCENFSMWYRSNPIDIGNACRRVMSTCHTSKNPKDWSKVADDPQSLGNGSLMRTLPVALANFGLNPALSQGRLTHNNLICNAGIEMYYKNLEGLLYNNCFRNVSNRPIEPTGHIYNTIENALFWAQWAPGLEEAIIGAVNHGGDADTIAAITGSLVGALYGYEAIPERWIEQLNPKVKKMLDIYTKLFEKINKRVCTNN